MALKLNQTDFNKALRNLSEHYWIVAPRRFAGRGRFSDTDLIQYGEINGADEIVWDEKSTFSPKTVVFPINQPMFYFKNDQTIDPTASDDAKAILVFLRACDIHGMERLDNLFLQNGLCPDHYYQQHRKKIHVVLMECAESFENCFCVSMGTNQTEQYSMAARCEQDTVFIHIQDATFENYFQGLGASSTYAPAFIEKNYTQVNLPDTQEMPAEMYSHPLWTEYKARCIACGRCNTTCPTCSCFTTTDVADPENPDSGERRRTWAGCHLDGFTNMAGGHEFRKDNASRMRFKTFHKIHDFKKRFGVHMCVGCGRCDDNCPEYISFRHCINKVTEALSKK